MSSSLPNVFSSLPDIIEAASKSPAALVALGICALSILAAVLFRSASDIIKAFIYVVILGSFSAATYIAWSKAGSIPLTPTAKTKLFVSNELAQSDISFSLLYPSSWYVDNQVESPVLKPKLSEQDNYAQVSVSYSYGSYVGFEAYLKAEIAKDGNRDDYDEMLADFHQGVLKTVVTKILGRIKKTVKVQNELGDSPSFSFPIDLPVLEYYSKDEEIYTKELLYVVRQEMFPLTSEGIQELHITCSAPYFLRAKASSVCDEIFSTITIANANFQGD